jgi:hypothetical protein
VTHLVELCAGTASVSLWALGRVGPLCGYMGSKRRWAGLLVDAMGVRDPDRVTLVDAGPWGDVWTTLREAAGRRATAGLLDAWAETHPDQLWRDLVKTPPSTDAAQRAAQYLWLQARSAGTIPVWWNTERERWESPTGSRTEAAHLRGGSDLTSRGKDSRRAKPREVAHKLCAGRPASTRCAGHGCSELFRRV